MKKNKSKLLILILKQRLEFYNHELQKNANSLLNKQIIKKTKKLIKKLKNKIKK